MNFPTVPLPLRFDGQTEQFGWLGWLSQTYHTGGDDLFPVLQQLTKITPSGDLYGIENTNRGCTLSTNFLPGQVLNPSLSIDGTNFDLGIITRKADTNDSQALAVNPGGVPLFKGGAVGGVGVVSTSPEVAEYAAYSGAVNSGLLNVSLPPPGVVMVGGVALPFVNQMTPPAGTSAGTLAGYNAGSYEVPAKAGTLPPDGYLVGPNAGSMLSQNDVAEIVANAVATANTTRAVIRLPIGSTTRMTIAVSDVNGTLLALYRMPDGTVFSVDVAASKAQRGLVQYVRRDRFARRAGGDRGHESHRELRISADVFAGDRRLRRWAIFSALSVRHCKPLYAGIGRGSTQILET